jgi:hypothetical protein
MGNRYADEQKTLREFRDRKLDTLVYKAVTQWQQQRQMAASISWR